MQAVEISAVLKKQIEAFELTTKLDEVGTVVKAADGIATIYGLRNAMAGELLDFGNKLYGLVLNLEEDVVGCAILGNATSVKEGDEVNRTGHVASIPTGMGMLGRVVNAVGQPIDGKGEIKSSTSRVIEFKAPGIIQRQSVKQPLQTGIKAIDSMIPIGRGQRELIIGDRQTGKTAIAVDTIINQKKENVLCIYVAIGQKTSTVAKILKTLNENDAMSYTTIVVAGANDSPTLQFIAPYSGCAIAEEFMYNHKRDVLIVYDDLSKHAVAYRQLSLLLERPPGREAYPGDVFYLHSRLLERAAKLSDKMGGGSLTALPIIETQEGDVSAYIPTNVISITDGQIYLESDLFYAGIRPAINAGISVSRVGGAAQIKAMKQVAGMLRLDLAQFREMEAFAQFSSDLDESTQKQLRRGMAMREALKQDQYVPQPIEEQVLMVFAGTQGYLDEIPIDSILKFESSLYSFVRANYPEITKKIKEQKVMDKDNEAMVRKAITECKEAFLPAK